MADQTDPRTTLVAAGLRRDIVRVSGPETVEFLQGQLSQDVAALEVGASAPSLLLQPTGKVDAWLRVTRLADDELLLDVDAGYGALVESRLRRFKLRTKVDTEAATWSGLALRGPGASAVEPPPGTRALTAAWPGIEGVDLLGEGELALVGVPLVGDDVLEGLRIECGVPAMGAELTDTTIPAEAGAWIIASSVSFTKGCYTGQELVARIDSRGGNVPRPVRGLLVEGDPVPAGAAVEDDTGSVGTVTSSGRSPALGAIALAVVGRNVEIGQGVGLRWDGGSGSAIVAELPLR